MITDKYTCDGQMDIYDFLPAWDDLTEEEFAKCMNPPEDDDTQGTEMQR